jgi:hypothetical protein
VRQEGAATVVRRTRGQHEDGPDQASERRRGDGGGNGRTVVMVTTVVRKPSASITASHSPSSFTLASSIDSSVSHVGRDSGGEASRQCGLGREASRQCGGEASRPCCGKASRPCMQSRSIMRRRSIEATWTKGFDGGHPVEAMRRSSSEAIR